MTPNTKVYYNGQRINQPRKQGKYTTPWYKRFISYMWRMTKITVSALVGAAILIQIGATFFSTHTIEAQTVTLEPKHAILDRIADCESGGGKIGGAHQFNKDGSVVIHKNSNGTYDIGKWQINSIHLATAMKMNLNLFTDEGNAAFAKYMWENNGTGDWDSSASCWRK